MQQVKTKQKLIRGNSSLDEVLTGNQLKELMEYDAL